MFLNFALSDWLALAGSGPTSYLHCPACSLPVGPAFLHEISNLNLTMSEDSDVVAKCVSALTIGIVTSLYLSASVVYHLLVQPPMFLAVLFNLTWLLALWSYLQAALTDPGSPKCPEWQDWSRVRSGLPELVAEEAAAKKRWLTRKTYHRCEILLSSIVEISSGLFFCPKISWQCLHRTFSPLRCQGKKLGWSPGKPGWCSSCRRERPERPESQTGDLCGHYNCLRFMIGVSHLPATLSIKCTYNLHHFTFNNIFSCSLYSFIMLF